MGPAESASVTEIDTVNPYPAIFLGGFGMMATSWLTRSMRARRSQPVAGVTPVTLPARAPPPSARSRSCHSAAAA